MTTGKTRHARRVRREDSEALKAVKENITEPSRWVNPDHLIQVMRENPSLRGFTYGYVSEDEFVRWLERRGVESHEHFKPGEHDRKASKSDRTLSYGGGVHRIQLKSIQTHSLRDANEDERADGIQFVAAVQNDASDSRTITLPNGNRVHTTCYASGDYEVLAVSIQPFVREWEFAFKRNDDLRRTTDKRYSEEDRHYLLATTEIITWPLTHGWTRDLWALLGVSEEDVTEVITEPDAEPSDDQGGHVVALVEDDAESTE